jgi:hypothetical protein
MNSLIDLLSRVFKRIKKLIEPLRNRKGKKRWIEQDGVAFFKALGIRPGNTILDLAINSLMPFCIIPGRCLRWTNIFPRMP